MPDNDEAQWVDWYRTLEKPLYNLAYRWLWDAAEAQDVVQDAFLRCWKIRERVVADSFKALIFQTTLRLASNRLRRRRLWRFVPFADDTADARGGGNDDILAGSEIRRALDALPAAQKQVLLLCELGGLTYTEVAEVMNISEGTVGSRRNRALAALRERLAARGVEWHED